MSEAAHQAFDGRVEEPALEQDGRAFSVELREDRGLDRGVGGAYGRAGGELQRLQRPGQPFRGETGAGRVGEDGDPRPRLQPRRPAPGREEGDVLMMQDLRRPVMPELPEGGLPPEVPTGIMGRDPSIYPTVKPEAATEEGSEQTPEETAPPPEESN